MITVITNDRHRNTVYKLKGMTIDSKKIKLSSFNLICKIILTSPL